MFMLADSLIPQQSDEEIPPQARKTGVTEKLKQHFKSNSKHEISDETDYYQFTKQWHKENVAD